MPEAKGDKKVDPMARALSERIMVCTEMLHEKPPFSITTTSSFNSANNSKPNIVTTRRVCRATKDLAAGEILLKEKAFEYSIVAALEDKCLECEREHDASPGREHECRRLRDTFSYLFDGSDEMAQEFTVTDVLSEVVDWLLASTDLFIDTLDSARCFLKLMARYASFSGTFAPIFKLLPASNIEDCLFTVRTLRDFFPMVFPPNLNDETAAQILAIMKTNALELDGQMTSGSGLFVLTRVLESSCLPNCSYTTHGDEVWVTAIKPIARGEALTVDFNNNFYRPLQERQEDIFSRSGYICNCAGCAVTTVDYTRAFCCPACNKREIKKRSQLPPWLNGGEDDDMQEEFHYDLESLSVFSLPSGGRICPAGAGEDIDEWRCVDCNYKPSEKLVNRFFEVEEKIKQKNLISVNDIIRILHLYPIHESNYLIFWSLSEVVQELTANKILGIEKNIPKGYLSHLWNFLVDSLNLVLPYPHSEKIIYYDLLAQVEVSDGRSPSAQAAYQHAYQVSCLVCGAESPSTRDLKSMAERVPQSLEEMKQRYDSQRLAKSL